MAFFLRKLYFVVSLFGGIILAIIVGWFAGKAVWRGGDTVLMIVGYGSGILTFLFCILQCAFFVEYKERKVRNKLIPEGLKPAVELYAPVFSKYIGLIKETRQLVIVDGEQKQARIEPLSFVQDWNVIEHLYNGKVTGRELTIYFDDFEFLSMKMKILEEKKMQQFEHLMRNLQ